MRDSQQYADLVFRQFFPADLCFLALGFLGPQQEIIKQLELETDPRSNIKTPAGSYATSVEGVYAAGDCRRGQSLIVYVSGTH